MESLLDVINLEQLGVSAILVAWLMWDNHTLKKENRELMDYARDASDKYQELAARTIEIMARIEAHLLANGKK